MQRWLIRLLRGPVIRFLKRRLKDEDFLNTIADMANDRIDIPIVSEPIEQELFRGYIHATSVALIDYLENV